jgi:hypothetical protein
VTRPDLVDLALRLAAVTCAVFGGAACTVGDGNGAASGPIYVLGCTPEGHDYGERDAAQEFDLQPHFFAGEPVEDISVANQANRLLIRIQRNGNRIEVNDTLYFDAQNVYEIGRCVRGRIKDGAPDYLTRGVTDLTTGLPTALPWCDWSGAGDSDAGADAGSDAGADAGAAPGPDGGVLPAIGRRARINLAPDEVVRSSLSLLYTCHQANLVGLAVAGWIEFQDFGGAAQPDVAPELRGELTAAKFKINFGDRLRATFHVVLDDQRRFNAITNRLPIPDPQMGGVIDGFFDFDLERGRAAQPFP